MGKKRKWQEGDAAAGVQQDGPPGRLHIVAPQRGLLQQLLGGRGGLSDEQVMQLVRAAGTGGVETYKRVRAIRKAWVADQVARDIRTKHAAEQYWCK